VQTLAPDAPASAPDFDAVYREHHGFVARTLRHLGVDAGRVDDAVQDSFLVVHRRLAEFEGRAALRTWLFEIARRVAGRYRRTAAREDPRNCPLDELAGPSQQDDELARAEAAELLRVFLDELDRDKSVIFILSELEQWRVPEIAESLDLNINTVYARLRAARKQLDRVVARVQARDRRPRIRRGAEVVAAALIAVPPPNPDLALLPHVAAGKLGFLASTAAAWTTGLTLAAVIAVVAVTSRPPTADPAPAIPITRTVPPKAPTITPPAEIAAATTARLVTTPARSEPASLAAELALLEAARAALLADDARAALTHINRHQRRFPASALAQEAATTRIDALCRLGDLDAARREAKSFARRWPQVATADEPCSPKK
jgi:RNA polymerase sigma-70 factor (ECF subfamily)